MSDREWLERQTGNPFTEDEVEEFLERVGICHYDGGQDINDARVTGHRLLLYKRFKKRGKPRQQPTT